MAAVHFTSPAEFVAFVRNRLPGSNARCGTSADPVGAFVAEWAGPVGAVVPPVTADRALVAALSMVLASCSRHESRSGGPVGPDRAFERLPGSLSLLRASAGPADPAALNLVAYTDLGLFFTDVHAERIFVANLVVVRGFYREVLGLVLLSWGSYAWDDPDTARVLDSAAVLLVGAAYVHRRTAKDPAVAEFASRVMEFYRPSVVGGRRYEGPNGAHDPWVHAADTVFGTCVEDWTPYSRKALRQMYPEHRLVVEGAVAGGSLTRSLAAHLGVDGLDSPAAVRRLAGSSAVVLANVSALGRLLTAHWHVGGAHKGAVRQVIGDAVPVARRGRPRLAARTEPVGDRLVTRRCVVARLVTTMAEQAEQAGGTRQIHDRPREAAPVLPATETPVDADATKART